MQIATDRPLYRDDRRVSLRVEVRDKKYAPAPNLRDLVSAGRLGRKSGRGVYDYATATVPEKAPEKATA